jgi:hypothetical protein
MDSQPKYRGSYEPRIPLPVPNETLLTADLWPAVIEDILNFPAEVAGGMVRTVFETAEFNEAEQHIRLGMYDIMRRKHCTAVIRNLATYETGFTPPLSVNQAARLICFAAQEPGARSE